LYKLLTSADHRTSSWSGGTTTELCIFPPEASYSARDFAWRLSTAVVSVEESTFTSLPGYERILMVLDGKMHLVHAGHHEVELKPFEQDRFLGDWQTQCLGSGQDFNLMLGNGWQGSLESFILQSGESYDTEASAYHCVFCVQGVLKVRVKQEQVILKSCDLLLCQGEPVNINCDDAARVIVARVIKQV